MLLWHAGVYFCLQYEITLEFAYNGIRLMSCVLACRHIPSLCQYYNCVVTHQVQSIYIQNVDVLLRTPFKFEGTGMKTIEGKYFVSYI